jgi:hypothetical protein
MIWAKIDMHLMQIGIKLNMVQGYQNYDNIYNNIHQK